MSGHRTHLVALVRAGARFENGLLDEPALPVAAPVVMLLVLGPTPVLGRGRCGRLHRLGHRLRSD
ncbi:hypothetical protein ACN6LM_002972 [Streptomyces sp. SAS_281]|uniref:hypothetical protein n=1 Tax=Streptomyces sp. SAS_281 TaxID=3412744 RepID=UPI00403C02A7